MNQDFQQRLLEWANLRDKLWESIQQQVKELEEILLQFEPFDIIANVALMNALIDPETYKEYAHEGNDAYTEYITLLYLTKPYDTYPERQMEVIPGQILQEIQERVRKLFTYTILYYALEGVGELEERERLIKALRFSTLSRSFLVRYPAYQHHLVDMLRELFTPLEDELEHTLGFSIENALAIAEGISSLINKRLLERRNEAKKAEKRLMKAVKKYRQKKRHEEDIPLEMLESLANMRPSLAAQKIKNMMTAWEFFALGETFSFAPRDLARETGVALDKVKAFLGKMSLEFGEVEDRYRLPVPTHPLMKRPLIKQGERYFCPVPNLVFWSLRPAIEAYLNPDSQEAINKDIKLWKRYDEIRSKYVEDKAIQYLSEALQHAQVYQRLKYRVIENGQMKEYELDGLLILDSALFLVEAKGGSISMPTLRGAPERMIKDIKKLIAEPYLQVLRAKRYIQETDKPVFYLADETSIQIQKSTINRFFLISVTLEPMDAYVTNLYQLKELGLFEEGDLPWAVSLTDLRVISELVEYPCQFVHYLLRRQKLNELGKIQAFDELDLFSHYLQEGLLFDKVFKEEDPPDSIFLTSYTTMLDDYYLYITGQRKTPAPKPTQFMPEVMREIIAELESNHPSGYLDIACALLDMGENARRFFANNVTKLRRRTLEDGDFHDFSFIFSESRLGFTYMFAPSEQAKELEKRLQMYCNLKKYQTKSDFWFGLGCIADAPGWAHIGVVLEEPWKYDEELEELVKNLPSSNSDQHRFMPYLQEVDK